MAVATIEGLDDLQARLRGALIGPDDARFEEARRVWNGMIDRSPALIARCRGTADVVEAVRFANATGLPLSVRGGGHNVAGNAVCDGGVVVDLSEMRGVRVDPVARTVRAQGGCTLGDVDSETQLHGLAVPLGAVSETGIAGLTLSGGLGWLRRKHGLSCDNLVSADVVTADGRVVTASEEENPDLLWALRGGGGNFGAVTSFEYRAHPLGPEVAVAFVVYPADIALDALRFADDLVAEAPEAAAPLGILGRVPPAEIFPADAHGRPFVAFLCVYAGDADEGERVLGPLRSLGEPIVDLSGRMPFVDAQRLLDEDYPNGWHYYWKSIDLDALGDDVLERLVEQAARTPSAHSTIDVWYHGGAMGRVGARETAFGARPPYLIGVEANFEHGAEADENVAWVRGCIDELRPFSSGGSYLNFAGFFEEGEELARAAYGDENFARLAEVKRQYDPGNVFRSSGNVVPDSASSGC